MLIRMLGESINIEAYMRYEKTRKPWLQTRTVRAKKIKQEEDRLGEMGKCKSS